MPTTTMSQRIAANVRAEMARRRVTQTRMARHLCCTQPSISRRLNGTVPFNVDELAQVAEVLGVPITALLLHQDAA